MTAAELAKLTPKSKEAFHREIESLVKTVKYERKRRPSRKTSCP